MRLKSYFAATVEEAISLASRELGEDAMLVYSRETMPETRNLGRYEVVFALEAEGQGGGEAVAEPAGQAPGAAPVGARSHESGSAWRELRADVLEMKRQFARVERLLVHTAGTAAPERWSQAYEDVFHELLTQEFPADLAAAAVSALASRRAFEARDDRGAVVAELAALLAPVSLGRQALGGTGAHAFVGPAGGGKTTMLVKLAVLLGMERRQPLMLVSLDARRIGGADQLKTFAHILGVPFAAVDHRAGFERLLETEGRRQSLFIDTPGFSAEDLAEQSWLPAALRTGGEVATHLVLPAYARTRECARVLRTYEAFRPASLMLTHMDESETVGGVAGEVLRQGLPLSYCGTGQGIPEDIREADAQWLARRALGVSEEAAPVRAPGEASWAVA